MQLYEEEAKMMRERRQEVVERVVREMGDFEDSLRARLVKEAEARAKQAASSANDNELRRSRDALKVRHPSWDDPHPQPMPGSLKSFRVFMVLGIFYDILFCMRFWEDRAVF
jgi:hypothetical protein